MADVFLSYATKNRAKARMLAELLESEDFSVFWDREILKSEAEEGAARGVLVPVMIADVRIPLAFRSIQAVNPTTSSLSARDPELTLLRTAVNRLLGRDDDAKGKPAKRIRVLIESVSGSGGPSANSAAKALERMGKEAKEALPALIKATESNDFEFLDAVVDALDAIDVDSAAPALKTLYSRLERQRCGDVIDGTEPEDDLLGKLLILVGGLDL